MSDFIELDMTPEQLPVIIDVPMLPDESFEVGDIVPAHDGKSYWVVVHVDKERRVVTMKPRTEQPS